MRDNANHFNCLSHLKYIITFFYVTYMSMKYKLKNYIYTGIRTSDEITYCYVLWSRFFNWICFVDPVYTPLLSVFHNKSNVCRRTNYKAAISTALFTFIPCCVFMYRVIMVYLQYDFLIVRTILCAFELLWYSITTGGCRYTNTNNTKI